MFLFSPSGPATTIHNSSQYLALADLKNNLIQTRLSEFSDSTELGGILIFPYKNHSNVLLSPSGPATTIHNSSQYLVLMQLISKIISHKPGHLSFPILLK